LPTRPLWWQHRCTLPSINVSRLSFKITKAMASEARKVVRVLKIGSQVTKVPDTCFRILHQMAAQRFLCIHTPKHIQNKTIQAMYVKHSIEARSRSHCWRRKAISIIHSECVFVASYPTSNAHAPCYIVICGLAWSGFYIIS
jgi:hypothetical protein